MDWSIRRKPDSVNASIAASPEGADTRGRLLPITRLEAFWGEKRGTAVVFDLVLIGLAIALDPLPLTAFLIVLPSKRGVRKGAAFVFGWLASLAIVVTVTVLATGDNPPKPNTAPSLADLAVKIAIGVSLVAIGSGLG